MSSPIIPAMRSNDYRRLSPEFAAKPNRYTLISEMIGYWHDGEAPVALNLCRELDKFPESARESYSFDDVVDAVFEQCLQAARCGYSSLEFDLDYMETGNIQGETDADGNPLVDCDYFVDEEGRGYVHVDWNRLNSPHLAAELSSAFVRRGIWMSFPFKKNRALYNLSWIEYDEFQAISQMLDKSGGYEAYSKGVPIADIVA